MRKFAATGAIRTAAGPFFLIMIAGPLIMANAENFVFPANASVKSVRTVFGAKGDGTTDDTQPLANAFLDGGGIIYLPNGTYRVTAPIKCRSTPGAGPWIYGQSRDGVVIRLDDNAAGFGNASSPQAVIASHGIAPGGSISADFFFRQWHNLTVDAGNNPGAIGIRYYSNNSGVLDNVLIKGNGVYGLDMGWTNMNGPCLIRNVTVEGFNVGVYTNNGINSQTMVGVTVRNSRTIGVSASGQNFSTEDLVIENVPVAVDANCMLVIVNGTFKGTDPAKPAIINKAHAYLRNITTQGFSRAVESSTNSGVAGANVIEYVSHATVFAFTDYRNGSLNLPIKRPPPLQWEEDTSKWVNVQDHGAMPNDRFEDSEAIQKAIDAAAAQGKTTVYFPRGAYTIAADMQVHGSVRHIIGLGAADVVLSASLRDKGYGFVLREGAAPVVKFENICNGAMLTFRSNNSSALVIEHCIGVKPVAAGTGEIFISNSIGAVLVSNPAGRVWARQWNTEGHDFDDPHQWYGSGITDSDNGGGYLWILGLKTENGWMKIRTTNGGSTELLGAHIYNLCNGTKESVLFEVTNAFASFACVRETNFCSRPYIQHVKETRGGQTREWRGNPKAWALFSAAPSGPMQVRPENRQNLGRDAARPVSKNAVMYTCEGRRVSAVNSTGRGRRTTAGVYLLRTGSGIRRMFSGGSSRPAGFP